MKVWLDKLESPQIQAIERYCSKNDKLMCLRDKNDVLLAVGLSISSLHSCISKNGFRYFQCVYTEKQLYLTKRLLKKNYSSSESDIINNNYRASVAVWRPYVSVYEGILKHNDEYAKSRESYWYNCYCYYIKHPDKFSRFDLINRKNSYIKKSYK